MFRKILSAVLAVCMLASLALVFASCGDDTDDLKIGVILLGDDSEGYTYAHILGIEKAAENVGLKDSQIIWKYSVPENDSVVTQANSLISQGCSLIISNSYGHQDFMATAAKDNPDVTFVAMTGDYAAISGLDNLYNAFTNVYESRYVSGVVAGMKLKELVDNNKLTANNYDGENIKIGYVGAYNYAEVVSGYTAFYLGIKSIVPNVVMDVKYTSSWFDFDKEKTTAAELVASGCVIIGQHADSAGAPTAVQAAYEAGNDHVFSVGYNVSMLDVAPDVALTSATNEWSVYYTDLFNAFKSGDMSGMQNWSKGYSVGAVGTTELGSACAAGTQEKVTEVSNAIKNGTLHVFDTSKFTVNGATVTTAPVDLSYMNFAVTPPAVIYQGETVEAIKTSNGVSYFDESAFRAAPYFSLRIDGITELN